MELRFNETSFTLILNGPLQAVTQMLEQKQALMPSTDPEIESRCFVSRGSVQLDTIPQQIGDRIAGSYSFTRYSSGQRCATASGTFSAILHLPLSE